LAQIQEEQETKVIEEHENKAMEKFEETSKTLYGRCREDQSLTNINYDIPDQKAEVQSNT
jgi:hypothetical protein